MRPTLIEEMMAAGRGAFGLLIGDRSAPGYFDFSLRGLAGSFIAFLVVVAVLSYMPMLLGMRNPDAPSVGVQIIEYSVLLAAQIGFAALALRQMKRLDGFVPYLVAVNWVSFFLSLILVAIFAAGITGFFVLVVVGIAVIALQINILRLVVTLSPLQIAIVLVAQVIGFFVGLLIVGFIFPLSPEEIAQLATP